MKKQKNLIWYWHKQSSTHDE